LVINFISQYYSLKEKFGAIAEMNTKSIVNLYKYKKNLKITDTELKKIQYKKLKLIIKQAYENVPYYNKKFKNARIKPENIKSIKDINKLPIITKDQIQSTQIGNLLATNYKRHGEFRTTSGSSGLNLTIFIDKKTANIEEAIWTRALHQNGVRLRDKLAVITDPRHFSKKTMLEQIKLHKKTHISIFDNPKKQIELLNNFKPDVIRGYTSSLILIAEELKNKTKKISPRLIFTCAEQMHPKSRQMLKSVFNNSEIFDNYACSEFGLLAWECSSHKGYHINSDSIFIEVLKNEEPVGPEERGEIICTSLTNLTMPLIRYRIGDVGIRSKEECPCGVTLPMMKLVEGRVDDFLRTTKGELISPTIFYPYPFENMEMIKQFKVTQERKDKLKIELVVKENTKIVKQIFEHATKQIQQSFGKDMKVDFQILDKINLDSNGKLRKIISLIDRFN